MLARAMGQVLHGSATTTHAIRAAIQRSKAPLKELAARYRLDRKTVARWRKRSFLHDAPMGLTAEEEAVAVGPVTQASTEGDAEWRSPSMIVQLAQPAAKLTLPDRGKCARCAHETWSEGIKPGEVGRISRRWAARDCALSLWLVLAAAALALLWPALRPVHVEGFSASIVALGLHLARGTVGDFLPFAAFNDDYFGLTKLGAVYGVAALSPLVGGDTAMRVEMFSGAALCVAASAYLIRRWSNAPWLVVVTVLLLIPGVTESFYFFNDNVPAAGLMLAALALWAWRPTWPVAVLVGALTGYAVVIRSDIVLVATTAIPLMAVESHRFRQAAVLTAVSAVVAIVVLTALFAFVHATPLDALRAGAFAVKLWGRPPEAALHLIMVTLFLGAPSLLLLLLGASCLAHEKRWLRLALLAGVPLFVNLVLICKIWETRQLLVLTPFLGALVATGVVQLLTDVRDGRRIGPLLISVAIFVWLFSPAVGIAMTDGPHTLSGRMAGLRLWREWQQSVRDDFRRIDDLIASAPPDGRLVVLADGWNEDRYLHLELVRQGFRRVPLPAPCNAIGEAMEVNGRTVIELSLRQTFLPTFPALDAQRLERYAMPCLAAVQPERTVLLAGRKRLDEIYGESGRERGLDPRLAKAGIDRIIATSLDGEALSTLDQAYSKEAQLFGRPASAERAIDMTRSQTRFSRSGM